MYNFITIKQTKFRSTRLLNCFTKDKPPYSLYTYIRIKEQYNLYNL